MVCRRALTTGMHGTLFVTLRCTAYVEPPGWGQSMRLYLGEALLKAGRARLAEVIYREDLREFRNNGWALFGLAQSLRAQGKSAAARKVDEEFQRAWKNADVTLKASVF